MTDFLNPLGGRFIGRSGPVAPTTISGTIPDPPRGFLQLDPGTIIKGVVMGRENDGLVAIATDKGTIRVASNAPLPPGTHVTLEVRPTGDRLQVLILASDAVRSGAPGQQQPATSATAGQSPAPAAPNAAAPNPSTPNPTTPPASNPSATSTAPSGMPPAGTPTTGTPPTTTLPPTVGTPPPPSQTTTSIQVVGSTLSAIVLQPQSMAPQSPGTQPPGTPQPFQFHLPNGQVITLPAASLPAMQPSVAAAQPVIPQPTGGAAPALLGSAPPNIVTPAGQPALVARPPMTAPALMPPTASTLPGDVRQRILALFTVVPGNLAAAPVPGQPAAVPLTPASIAAPPLPPGAELHLRVLAVQIGNQHPIEIDPAAQLRQGGKESHIVFGRVIAVTPAGHAVIHTPVGNILLQQRSSLPVGAQLALAIDTVAAPPPAPVVAAPVAVQTPQQALLSLSRTWPTLADLIAILQGGAPHASGKGAIDPALARDILAHLPQMGSRLGAGLMAGMAALRSGEIGRLLGPLFAARGLGPEREEMVRRLRGEFAQISNLAQDRPEGEWRTLFLPYLDDQQRVQRINLFYRRHRKGEAGSDDGGGGTRFVVEADFTRLGPFQLDGLMRQHRFDLMIRSHQRLDDRMRRDIEAIYEEARGLTGFSGAIAFQTVDEFPVTPLEELKHQSGQVSV